MERAGEKIESCTSTEIIMKLKQHRQKSKRQSIKKLRRIAARAKRNKEVQSSDELASSFIQCSPTPSCDHQLEETSDMNYYWSDMEMQEDDNDVTEDVHWENSGSDDNNKNDNDSDDDVNSVVVDDDNDDDDDNDVSSEYVVSEMDSEDELCKKQRTLQQFKCTLRDSMMSHMSENIGGNMPEKRQQSTVNRLSELLAWSSDEIETDRKLGGSSSKNGVVDNNNNNNDSVLPPPPLMKTVVVDPTSLISVLGFLGVFITARFALLGKFTTYLEIAKRLSPSTIINWLNDLSYSFKWYVYTWSVNEDLSKPVLTTTLDPVNITIRNLRSSLRKAVRRINSRKTVESEVEAGRRPKEGMKRLIQIVRERVAWAQSLTKKSFENLVTFREFMKLLYASLYTSYGQGRLGGIQSLKFGQSVELLNKRTTSTTQFKTYSKYGFQFVTVEKESFVFFDIYLKYARPAIVERFQLSETLGIGFGSEKEKAQPLWLNASGKQDLDLSRKVTDFFKPYGMHITTTIVRSMVATESQELLDDGIITRGEMEGIAKTSGI